MRKFLLAVVTGIILLTVAGCSAPQAPEWLSGKSQLYPEQSFLTGVGVAEDRNRAEDRARLEIAKVFQVDIRARDESSEIATTLGGQSSYRQAAASRLVATSGRLLAGVTIAEVWRDPQTRSWHALAVLDRLGAGQALREGIGGLDRQIREQLALVEQAGSPLRSLAPTRRALRLQQQRDTLAADLRVVDPLAMSEEPLLPAGTLAARVAQLSAQCRAAVSLDNDRGDIVRAAVVRALAAEGLALVPAVESTLQLQGRVEVASGGESEGVEWRLATARLEVRENQQLVDTLQVTVREGSGEPERAETLARELLGRRLGEKVLELLGGAATAPGS